MAGGFKDLEVWQIARELAQEVFELTKSFPKEELYGLTGQLRRASVSVPSNIAEGWGRQSDGAFANSLSIAKGSLNEVQTQLILATDFGYLEPAELGRLETKIDLLGSKLYVFCERLGKRYVREEPTTYGLADLEA